jgi:hypothetical protein
MAPSCCLWLGGPVRVKSAILLMRRPLPVVPLKRLLHHSNRERRRNSIVMVPKLKPAPGTYVTSLRLSVTCGGNTN